MKIKYFHLCGFLLIFFLTSCTVYRELPIEVLKPGQIMLPTDSRISLIYRNFKYSNDTTANYFRKDLVPVFDSENAKLDIDSIITEKSLETLSEIFEDHQVASSIDVHKHDYMPAIKGEHLAPLNPEIIRTLARSNQADYIVSLETLSYLYSTYSRETASQACDVVLAGIWAIYNGKSGSIITHLPQVDTLYWDHFDDMGKRIQVPPRLEALKMAVEEYVQTFGNNFITDWITTQRVIIIPPVEEFRQAAIHAYGHEWDEAEKYWLRYTHERFGRLAFSARFNSAVKYEMSDDLNAALDWLDQAEETAKRYKNRNDLELLKWYSIILQERLSDMEKLIKLEESQK